MENKKIGIYYSDSISIIILDEYGRDTFKYFIHKSKEKLDSLKISIVNNNEILDLLKSFKSNYLCIIGDLKEKVTKEIVEKIKQLDKFKIYFLLRNCKDMKYNKSISICDIENERDSYYFLESVLYLQMYNSLVCIDIYDIWIILGNSKIGIMKTNLNNWKEELVKNKNNLKSKNLLVHFIVNSKEKLRETNLILEEIQKELNYPNMICMVTEHKKIINNEIEINIVYGEDENGFERDERTSY